MTKYRTLLSSYNPTQSDAGCGYLSMTFQVHILNSLSWTSVACVEITGRMPSGVVNFTKIFLLCYVYLLFIYNVSQALWKEPINWLQATHGRGFLQCTSIFTFPSPESLLTLIFLMRDERITTPHSISLIRPNTMKPQSKSGVAQLEWNVTGTLFFVRFGASSASSSHPHRDQILILIP